MQNKIQTRVRFDPLAHQANMKIVPSRNPSSKSQNVSVQHTRTNTGLEKEHSYEKAPRMQRSKQDSNPTVGRNPFTKGADSPPSLSMTASPEKTTEKKMINLQCDAK